MSSVQDGSLRLVVDYRKLNDVTHKNVYPLPRQDDLMAKLRNAKLFTKLDLQWGYNNVRIREGDEWKTAFRTKYGLFEYLVMPFGLTNAPAAFQHFMNDLFRDLIDVTVEHPSHVREVLSRLLKNQTILQTLQVSLPRHHGRLPWYCHFPAGFSMDQKKIEAVTTWPTPKTVKQVQAFLGHWSLNPRSDPLQSELPYYLETDASGVAMGAILSQRGPDNRLHPIAYMSKSFSGAEANYNTHDKELLAIIKALEEWRIFLEATDKPVQVFTDHRNLEYWMQARTFNRRHARWRIFLSDFNFEIHYRPGKQSGKTRRPVQTIGLQEELEIVTEIRSKLREDPSLEPIIQFLTEDADNAPPSIRKAYRDYDWEEDLLWYRGKLVVPDSEALKERLLREFHDSPLAGHPGQQRTLELLSRNYWWPGMKSTAKEWVECCPICQANRRAHAPVIALKPLEDFPSPKVTTLYWWYRPFSKFGHFIPTSKKVTARGLADLFITHVWKLHGLPIKTVSDRGTTFTGKFLRALYQQLGVKPAFSLAYHPDLVAIAEYAYNNAKHAATGKTPFELVYGRNPVMNPSNVPANVPEADNVADTLAREWKEAESALRLSKERMTRNQGTVPEYSIGEKPRVTSQPFPERPPPETIEGEEEYEVEQIIDSKRQRGKWFYLIKWKGYGPEDNSWEPEELLEHSQEEIQRFNKSQLKKARDSAKSL
ncbi:Chromo (CHRromatin Organization MOdifier) domain [Rhizoctonia solani]|uniref:Chromo (CHRromatin Organization MOdifier) domain n=1 Tax=Rhizoctonia solani TaxID=456999 RepID=A0A8H7I3B4_9AGAM|nr:Chromo (CHRromatin Organization MOdifier) domain [Rhizoctonia solani]